MTSVLAPSFLLELGAYAIAAAGIRLFRNRSSQARQQEAQEHPQTVYQHTSPRVIGLSQASPLLSTCRSSSRSPQPCPDDEVQSPQAAGTSCKDEAKGQGAVAQAADVVMPEADAVLLSPQPITPATGIAATPSDVPSRIIAPADTAFGHVTALSLTPLKGSRGNRFDNMGSDSISSHSHNSSLVHGNASRDFDVTVDTSDDCTSAENNTGVPSSNAACHNRAASKAPEAAAEGEQQQLQGSISKDEQQDMSSGPDRADAILPENVKLAHRDVDASSAGDCERTSGPSSHPMSEDDPDVDIMTREESPACDHMAVDDPSDGGNDVISDSETSKQEEEEVASGMEWAWGADTLDDDQCDNVDQDRSLLLSAIQKHKRSAEPDPENSEMQLFVSSKRPCGPLIDGVEEDEVKGSAQPATGDAGIPEGVKAGAAKAAQPNDLLQEIASVTLRLLAGALRHSPASEAAQPSPSPLSQAPVAQQEQSPDSDFINPAPSQDGETLAESGIEDEEGQLAEGNQPHSAGICVEAKPMLDEESEEAQHSQTSRQPSQFRSAQPNSLTEAEVCSQGSFGQPDQAMELQHAAGQEEQDSIQMLTLMPMTHSDDSHSKVAEAKEHSQVADATHQGAASSIVPMTTEDETDLKGRQTRDEDEGCGQHVWKLPEATSSRDWVQRWVHRCRPSLPGPAAKLLHLPHHDVMACPDSSPDAEAPRAMSLEPEADLAADDIQHGQISSDSAANALATSLPCESPASHPLVLGAAALALSMLGDSSSAAAISAPEALGAPAADTVNPANIAETRLAAPSGDCEEYEQAELKESDELCQADNAPVEHSAQRAEETEESGDEAHANKGDKYQPGERRYIHYLSSGLGNVAQPTLDLPRLLRYAGSCFSKSAKTHSRTTRGGSYQPNFCHESDYLLHDSPDQLQPQSTQRREQQNSGLLKKLPDHMDDICSPDVHEAQHGELAQASPAVSDEYESRAYCAHHPAAHAQTDWGRELPIVDSAPPIASSSPPGSPTTSSAWGSPDEPAVNSPSGSLAHSYSPEWGSARGAVSNRPRYRAVPASPATQSLAWGSPVRASRSSPLCHVSSSKSPVWQSPGRAARDSPECHSPVSPGSPATSPATLPHGTIHTHNYQSKPTRWPGSPDYVPPFWNLPEFASASAATAADDRSDYWQSLKEAEDRLSEPAMSPDYLPSGGGVDEEDQQMYAEPDHEEEDNGMAEIQQGQIEEEDHPDASKYEGAYASVCKATRDYVRDAWDLSDSSEEDAEDNVPARADLEHEAEDDGFQVKRSKYPDSGEEDEGMHGTRAAAGSSPGQALTPGPNRMLSQDEEEDCMLEEDDCKEKYLAASRESEGMLNEEGTNVEDDDVQFMGETGPDPSKSAFQLARKRLASIRASQRCGEEEDDVELYPGVQDLISGTLQSGRSTAHQVGDFAAELSKGSTILRHFKRLRKLPSASRTSELERSAFWSRHSSGGDLQPRLRATEADQPQAQAEAHASAHVDHRGKGGMHRSHAHHSHHRHHHHHRHGRRGTYGWRAEATAVAGSNLDSTLRESLSGGLPDSKEDEADRFTGQD